MLLMFLKCSLYINFLFLLYNNFLIYSILYNTYYFKDKILSF